MSKSNEVFTRYGEIYLGKDCFIGIGSTILPNVRIGFASIISANALIKKNLDAKGIYAKDEALIRKRVFDEKLFYK